MEDRKLIRRCRKRKPSAQKEMVERYSSYLYNICCRYTGDREFAKDCLQETWVQIFWNLDKYKEEGLWKAWIARVAINKCRDMLKKSSKWQIETVEDLEVGSEENEELKIIEEETVNAFMEHLPLKYRIIVNLFFVEDYSHKEIGEILEIKESSSRSMLSRAVRMMRNHFIDGVKEEGSQEGDGLSIKSLNSTIL